MSRYIVMDVVFYGSSLNYDWGGGTNYQELKKITKWDGRQYVIVSRYALRYSILHWANKLFPEEWKLAGTNELEQEKEGVVHPKEELIKNKTILEYPEFDLFGFMIAKKGSREAALTRTSPVKISHAISLTPTNLDTHTMANLDIVRRSGRTGSNPVTIEEKVDFYVYNVTIDVDRIGKYLVKEHGREDMGNISIENEKIKRRIIQLVETILNLKRDIKGRREDLSPWLVIVGLYKNGKYESLIDRITLDRKTHYKIIRTYKKDGDTEIIENKIEESLMPLFRINTQEITNRVLLYYRDGFCDYEPKDESKFEIVETKNNILEKVEEFLNNN